MIKDVSSKIQRPKSARVKNVPALNTFQTLLKDEEFEEFGLRVLRNRSTGEPFVYRDDCLEDLPQYEAEETEYVFSEKSDAISAPSAVMRHAAFRVPRYQLSLDWYKFSEALDPAPWLNEVTSRIGELEALAKEDDNPFDKESAKLAQDWISTGSARRRPSAFLSANGNVRLVFHNDSGQLGLQFLPSRQVQVVELSRGAGASRFLAVLDLDKLLATLAASGLDFYLGLRE